MIIMIILFVLLPLSLALLIFGSTTFAWKHDLEELSQIVGGFLSAVSGLATLVCGIVCGISNAQSTIATKNYEYQEKIILYKNEKTILESYHVLSDDNSNQLTSNITFEVISTSEYYAKVHDYNKKIFTFKVDIKQQQFSLNNKWISWFVCPACMSVSDETLNSLTYTIGK